MEKRSSIESGSLSYTAGSEVRQKHVDAVFVDRSRNLLDCFPFFYAQLKIDTYTDPQIFLDALTGYSKNTPVMLGYLFDGSDKNGIEFAEQLHNLGFRRLYLFTGMTFPESHVFPDYLTYICKWDMAALDSVLNESATLSRQIIS